MKKLISALFVFVILPLQAHAASDLADMYFSDKKLDLTPQEKQAMEIAKQWQSGSHGSAPARGPDGSITFVFGASQTSIVCAVLQVCDVQLQPGEQVNSIHLGDKVRWTVDPAITGYGANEVQHLIIKPSDVGLETTLIVTTNRRTYNLRLRSDRKEYMPVVNFSYPEEAMAKWEAIKHRRVQQVQRDTIPETSEYLGNLSFKYKVSGKAAWKPVRVYNDGVKTIIQMPKAMQETEAPSLLVVRDRKGLFSKDQEVVVNYRVQGDRYIVDSVFDKAVLIAGVGRHQERVVITKEDD